MFNRLSKINDFVYNDDEDDDDEEELSGPKSNSSYFAKRTISGEESNFPQFGSNQSKNLKKKSKSEQLKPRDESRKPGALSINNEEDEDDEENEFVFQNSDLYLCVFYQNGKLASSFYDANKKCLFYLNDLPENKNFDLTNLIINDTTPDILITNAKSDANFIEFLRKKCEPLSEEETLNDSLNGLDINDEDSDEDSEKEDAKEEKEEGDKTRQVKNKQTRFILMTNNDFNYDLAKEKIFQIKYLENMPDLMLEKEKNVFYSCLFNFESKLAIRSIGALLKHLDRNRSAIDSEEIPVYFVKPLSLEKLLFLDSNSFKSLQIFNDIDYQCVYRQTTSNSKCSRTTLNNKVNIYNVTLYGLFLSKMQTKIGISKLRSFLMKPTRDVQILTQRHRVVEFFMDNHNQELTNLVKSALKKCKFVSPIFKRMRITRVKFSDWKRLYRTTQSLVSILKLAKFLNERLNGKDLNKTETTSFNEIFKGNIFKELPNRTNASIKPKSLQPPNTSLFSSSHSLISEAFDFKGILYFTFINHSINNTASPRLCEVPEEHTKYLTKSKLK